MRTVYKINVFEKADAHPSRRGVGTRKFGEIDPEYRLFVREFASIAASHDISPDVRTFKWPTPDYAYLQSDPYKSDVGMLFADSLDDIGLELAHMIHGTRYPLHVLVVTRSPIDNEHTEEVRYGLNAISRDVIERSEGVLVTPRMESPSTYDAEALGHIHYFDIPSMRKDGARERLHKLMLT